MALTGHPNFVLGYTAPWRGIQKVWSITSNHSGATLSTDQALAFLQAIHNDVITAYFSPNATLQFLSFFAYYDGQNSASLIEDEYGDAAASESAGWNGNANYGGAYTGTESGLVSGLETCCVLKAPIGVSKTNKPVLMRKFIHGVPGSVDGSDTFAFATGGAGIAAKLGDGSLPGNRVLCSAKGGQGVWAAQSFMGNHKLYRKYTSKKTNLNDAIGNLINDGLLKGVNILTDVVK